MLKGSITSECDSAKSIKKLNLKKTLSKIDEEENSFIKSSQNTSFYQISHKDLFHSVKSASNTINRSSSEFQEGGREDTENNIEEDSLPQRPAASFISQRLQSREACGKSYMSPSLSSELNDNASKYKKFLNTSLDKVIKEPRSSSSNLSLGLSRDASRNTSRNVENFLSASSNKGGLDAPESFTSQSKQSLLFSHGKNLRSIGGKIIRQTGLRIGMEDTKIIHNAGSMLQKLLIEHSQKIKIKAH